MKSQFIHSLDKVNIKTVRYGKMKTFLKYGSCASLLAMLMLPVSPVQASVFVQCPGDTDGDATWNSPGETQPDNVVCMHLSSGDGYANMADGYRQYIFGFGDLTGVPPEDAGDAGILNAQISAPTIQLRQGEEFYLTLTNTGMLERPDLFDGHSVHFHGFPNASSVFDGVPDASIAINMGASMTYFYNIVEPGTYLYHCHVEAAEHMQMGMQGNLYVHPAQDGTAYDYPSRDGTIRSYTKFAYNDADPVNGTGDPGSTGYDVEYPLQLIAFDHNFHDKHIAVQPLPFAEMKDDYHMFNGRGYPASVQPADYYVTNPGAAQTTIGTRIADLVNGQAITDGWKQSGTESTNTQPYSSKITVAAGQKLLLRITNLSITNFHTVTALGLPMKVIGQGGREMVDKYETSSVNLGGGEAYDVIIDTMGITPGTYFVYTNELHQLSNREESFGGAMTEIVVTPAI
jgi:FtsP/CotA-like multicopper oxidase with cupredoxin domain